MDPYDEQKLREEVIYLHSLWHQGPPRNPTINPNPPPLIPNPSTYHPYLQPSNSTHFKRASSSSNKRGKRGKKGKTRQQTATPPPPLPPVSNKEWPVNSPASETLPPGTSSGWPVLKPRSATREPPSAADQARFGATQLQQKALRAAHEFFKCNAGSDGQNDFDLYDTEEDEDGDEDDLMGEDGCEDYRFFLKVFMDDEELRGYYEKNYDNGDFICLVCGGIGKKTGKRFRGCVALVQHSTAIAKTKKRLAHRALGQAICKVLGWDIHRLPTIVLTPPGDKLSNSLAKPNDAEGKADDNVKENLVVHEENVDTIDAENGEEDLGVNKENADSIHAENGEELPKLDCNASRDLADQTDKLMDSGHAELKPHKDSLVGADVDKSKQDFDGGLPNVVEEGAEGAEYGFEAPEENVEGMVEVDVQVEQNNNVVLDALNENAGVLNVLESSAGGGHDL